MIYVETAQDFYDGWETMGISDDGNKVSIDTVYIQVHGEPENILSSNGQKIYADKLNKKSIDTVILTACNTGNMDFSSNFATQLVSSQEVNQVIAPDGLGFRPTNHYAWSQYSPEYSGVERTGNGFVLYQQIQNSIQITPNLTMDKKAIKLTDLRLKGNIYSYLNQQYYQLRENTSVMTINQLLNRIVGLE